MPNKANKRKRAGKEPNESYILYVVSKGRTTALLRNWLACYESSDDRVKGATLKGFNSV